MRTYTVEALEKFIVRTSYTVEADSPEQAEALCKSGNAAYDESEIEEGDEEWLETVSIEEGVEEGDGEGDSDA
jgi:hypothetical protein